MYLTEKFARLIVNSAYRDLPLRAVERAKECILDCVGVAIAGSAEPVRGPLQHYLNAIGGPEQATVIGLGRRTSMTNAALVNGVFGHVLDYDDTNQIFIGHGSVVVVPAILALAEQLGASGKDM